MKRMVAIAIVTVLILISVCGCSMSEDISQATVYAEEFLDFVLANDRSNAYSMVSNICTEEEFTSLWEYMRQAFNGATEYTLKSKSWKTNTNALNGITTKSVSFNVFSNNGQKGTFDIVIRSDINGLAGCTYTIDSLQAEK